MLSWFAVSAQAANHYIRDGGTASTTGTGSCTGWATANACDTLPATLQRGDTYYIADGTYGAYTFDDANSGSTLITIKKATASDHGTDTDWVSTYGDGQAVFNGDLTFTRGYYTIDGQTGGGPSSWETGFGIVLNGGIDMPQFVDNNADNITLQHMEIDVGQTGPNDVRGMTLYASNGFTIRYVYLHDSGCDMISMNAMNDFTLEYSKVARNRQAEPGCHGDLIEYQIDDASNFVIRYNFFEDIVGSYAFGSHGPTITGYYIYGNIFYFTQNSFFGNGLVGCLSGGGTLTNMKFYNNTIAGVIGDGGYGYGFGRLGGTGNEARNNLWYRSSGTTNHSWSDATTSNNTGYNMGAASFDQLLSGDPFVSYPTNLSLAAASTAGTTLSSPYNVDMLGNTRGGDGTWDRGALEYGAGGTAPNAPSNLRLISWAGWLLGLGLLGGLMQRMRHGAFNDWWRGTRAARIIHSLLRAAADGLGRSKATRQAG